VKVVRGTSACDVASVSAVDHHFVGGWVWAHLKLPDLDALGQGTELRLG